MNILLFLDPFSTDLSMANHRSIIYRSLFLELNCLDIDVKIYTSKVYAKNFFDLPGDSLILTNLEVWENVDKYFAYAQNNLVPNHFANKIKLDFEKINFKPDLIITNSPSSILRKIWGDIKIFHYELGFFNRYPFPIYHQLDPLGFYHKSMLSQFPCHNFEIENLHINSLHRLKEDFINKFQISEVDIGSIDAVYVPLPSFKTWSVATEIFSSNRIDYLNYVVKKFPKKLIIVNEKPQYPLNDFELDVISKINNVKLIGNSDSNGEGSHLAMLCRSVYTFSPSLSLQCIFWGNHLDCPDCSSMKIWSLTSNNFNKLASYVYHFNFSDFSDCRKIIF